MANQKLTHYPHPVLGNPGDFTDDSHFKVSSSYSPHPKNDTLVFDFSFDLSNSALEDLIESQQAVFVVDLDSRQNFYHQLFLSYQSQFKKSIPVHRLEGLVELNYWICAREEFYYHPVGIHPNLVEFKKYWQVEKDSVLATAGSEKIGQPTKPVHAFIKFQENREIQDGLPMQIKYDNDDGLIKVLLGPNDYQAYCRIQATGKHSQILHGQLALPALIGALQHLKDNPDTDSLWSISLQQICQKKQINPTENPIEAAQKLLLMPNRALENIIS